MTNMDPIDYSTYTTPEPSESLTRDILGRVGREAAVVPARAVPRLAVAGALMVAAAAAAVLVWKLRGDDRSPPTHSVATEAPPTKREPAPEPDPAPTHPRRISPAERSRLLTAISAAHEQRAGSAVLALSRADIQAAMQELRPLIAECHEMALERTPGFFGVLKVNIVLVGEPGMATVVAEADAIPGSELAVDPEFIECVTETIMSVELAAPATPGRVSITYPFVFRAPGDDPAVPGPTHRLPPTGADPLDTADVLDEARAAAKGGEWGKALKLVHQVLEQEPESQDALMVGVLAACNLQNADLARGFNARLQSPARRGMGRQACRMKDIEIP